MIEEWLHDAIALDPETGSLTWKERPEHHFKSPVAAKRWNSARAGKPALAASHAMGYRHGAFTGKHFLAHRVVWFLAYGKWPDGEVDHINGDRSDNRVCNLRDVTRSQNSMNSAPMIGRKSKFKGVTQVQGGKWGAYCKKVWLGVFNCETAALFERVRKERETFGEYRRLHHGTI